MMLNAADYPLYYQALLAKDVEYDGLFYVGVKTTGVFCRPTCPARKPKFENCEFYPDAQSALLASYRPCLRCQPLSHPNQASPLVQQLVAAVEANPEKRWTDADFDALSVDAATARRQFQKRFGMSFVEYARARRMGLAMKQIRDGKSVIDAQLAAGYDSGSGFRDAFSRIMGAAPVQAKARGKAGRANAAQARAADSANQASLFASESPLAPSQGTLPATPLATPLKASWLDTRLGPMLAVVDEQALHLLEFVDRRGLEREIERLRARRKQAIVPGETAITVQIAAELAQYFAGERTAFETPLALLGSAFQQRVWAALQAIPIGETRSYADVAAAVGNPAAVRAVAQANGANQLAIVIPCHRVINADGELGGYGGGLSRKQWLLAHERQLAGRH